MVNMRYYTSSMKNSHCALVGMVCVLLVSHLIESFSFFTMTGEGCTWAH